VDKVTVLLALPARAVNDEIRNVISIRSVLFIFMTPTPTFTGGRSPYRDAVFDFLLCFKVRKSHQKHQRE